MSSCSTLFLPVRFPFIYGQTILPKGHSNKPLCGKSIDKFYKKACQSGFFVYLLPGIMLKTLSLFIVNQHFCRDRQAIRDTRKTVENESGLRRERDPRLLHDAKKYSFQSKKPPEAAVFCVNCQIVHKSVNHRGITPEKKLFYVDCPANCVI